MEEFSVRTEVFEGPLEVLLGLIEKRKLLINQVSLATVADDFISYLKAHPEFPLAETAHFVLIASTLLLIKSKSLLPTLALSAEETHSINDLELRLTLLDAYRKASRHPIAIFGATPLFSREASGARVPIFSPPATDIPALHAAMRALLLGLPKLAEPLAHATVRKVVSLEEMVERMRARVERAMRTNFRDLANVGKAEKVEVVVSFLALLELVKQGVVKAEQESHATDIVVETHVVGLPRYG